MLLNPKLYEINTRVWIKQFGKVAKINSIPLNVFQDLADKGINIIWLMGIWKTCSSIITKCCYEPELITAYNKSLNDWNKDDVIGSPFAIDKYEVNHMLGSWEDIGELKIKLNEMRIKLFLDFIPNHLNADSTIIKSKPEIFLEADEENLNRDPHTFYKHENSNRIFAHGRDPLFPAWSDTIQINFFKEEARNFLISSLLKLADICDGVRCDMAMLLLNNIFYNTWSSILNKYNFKKPDIEFWKTAIETVKAKSPEFTFLAECYWDLEWDLQQLGFDFTYDKRLTDYLAYDDINGVLSHLRAEEAFQRKSVRFIENHDEQRAIAKFGKQKSLAAATVISTIPGMKLYYDGQFEGKKIKLPLQLGREPYEKVSETKKIYYEKLLQITKNEIFTNGEWKLLEPLTVNDQNITSRNIFAWQWKYKNDHRIVIINYSDSTSQCRLNFEIDYNADSVVLIDLLNEQKYIRNVDEIRTLGLFVELKAYNSHIFSIKKNQS
jgi:glycosidase